MYMEWIGKVQSTFSYHEIKSEVSLKKKLPYTISDSEWAIPFTIETANKLPFKCMYYIYPTKEIFNDSRFNLSKMKVSLSKKTVLLKWSGILFWHRHKGVLDIRDTHNNLNWTSLMILFTLNCHKNWVLRWKAVKIKIIKEQEEIWEFCFERTRIRWKIAFSAPWPSSLYLSYLYKM